VNGSGGEDLLVLNSDCVNWRGYLVDSAAIVGTREVDQVAFATLEVGGPAPSRGLDVGDVDGDGTDDESTPAPLLGWEVFPGGPR
jgi:hypothetical protein